MELISKRAAGLIFISGLFLILFFGFFSSQPLVTDSILTLGLLLLTFFLYRPKWGVFLILFIRPSIDKFSDTFSVSINKINLNSSAILGSLVIMLLLIFIIKNWQVIKSVPLKKYWIFFLLLIIGSILFSIDLSSSLYEVIRILSIFLIFVSVFIITKEEKNYRNITYAIIYSAIIPFLFATYQLLTGTGLGGTSGIESRLFGTFSHPNPFASFVLIVLTVSLFFFVKEKIRWQKWILGILIVWGIFLLIQTYSRGAWFAFLIFLIILTVIRYPKFLLGIILAVIVLFFVSGAIRDRIDDIYNPPADSSVRWRFAQWERMFGLFLKKPLTGYGIGTETIVHEREFGWSAGNQYTHNDFLRVALETGALGVISYFVLLMVALFKLIFNYRQEKNPWIKDFGLFVLALFVAMLSFSLTNNTLRETVTQWTIWGLVAIALSLYSQKDLFTKRGSTSN
jgi:O-antigen ligase